VLESRTVGSRRALGLTQIVACRCRPPTRAQVFGPPQDGPYLPPCKRDQSSVHERTPLARGRARPACPPLDAMPPRQPPCSNNRSRRPHRAPAQLTGFPPHLRRRRLAPQTPAPRPLLGAPCTLDLPSSPRRQHRPSVARCPHLRHIHRRLPLTAASFTQTPRSPPRRKCVGEPRTGRPGGGLQLVGAPSSREDGIRGDGAGWGDARSASVCFLVGGIS
jgi:hypothetical protein